MAQLNDTTVNGSLDVSGAINTDGSLTVNNRMYGTNKILWSGAYYMQESQTITLSEAISAQPHGVVFVFSAYSSGVEQDYEWNYVFVPKYHVSAHSGKGIGMGVFASSAWGSIGTKYLYVNDTSIIGNANNSKTGASNGITYASNYWVLRYVIGV